jgi:hypothetical protein
MRYLLPDALLTGIDRRDADECWPWTGASSSGRMAPVTVTGSRERAYRLVYAWLVGPIPAGHHLHHRCENPLCCNPAHLEPLTPAEHKRRHPRHAPGSTARSTQGTQTAANEKPAAVAETAG